MNESVSVVCGFMDRHEALRQTLPNWLAFPEIGEVIVVDFGSSVPVEAVTDVYDDARLRIVHVRGQTRWIASKCHNLGVRLAAGGVLLRLDADYWLEPDFFAKHPLADALFFAGNRRIARTDNERHLAGALYVHKRHVIRVNGYDERIVTYGDENDDLYERLARAGLSRRDFDLDSIHHLPHEEALRVQLRAASDVQRETENKQTAGRPWTALDRMTAWRVRPGRNGAIECEEVREPSRMARAQ